MDCARTMNHSGQYVQYQSNTISVCSIALDNRRQPDYKTHENMRTAGDLMLHLTHGILHPGVLDEPC